MNYKHPIYIEVNYEFYFLSISWTYIVLHPIWNKMEVTSLGMIKGGMANDENSMLFLKILWDWWGKKLCMNGLKNQCQSINYICNENIVRN
jgi:hypothetical protein